MAVPDILFEAIEDINGYFQMRGIPVENIQPELLDLLKRMDDYRAWCDADWGQDGYPSTVAEFLEFRKSSGEVHEMNRAALMMSLASLEKPSHSNAIAKNVAEN